MIYGYLAVLTYIPDNGCITQTIGNVKLHVYPRVCSSSERLLAT